jgi:hypothetical protein
MQRAGEQVKTRRMGAGCLRVVEDILHRGMPQTGPRSVLFVAGDATKDPALSKKFSKLHGFSR